MRKRLDIGHRETVNRLASAILRYVGVSTVSRFDPESWDPINQDTFKDLYRVALLNGKYDRVRRRVADVRDAAKLVLELTGRGRRNGRR